MDRHSNTRRLVLVVLLCCCGFVPAFAQGTEKAIEAAILFTAIVGIALIAALVISIAYVFQRRQWQRWVVLVFGVSLLIGSVMLSINGAHRSMDMEFTMHALCVAGILFALVGLLVRPCPCN